jgi:HEAT repeat protein
MVRWTAARALGRLGFGARDRLIEMLSDEREVVRICAAHSLGELGNRVVPALIDLLRQDDDQLADGAGLALAAMEKPPVQDILEVAEQDDPRLRRRVAKAFQDVMSFEIHQKPIWDREGAKRGLLALLGDAEASVRQAALRPLWAIDKRDPKVVSSICAALRDEDEGVRGVAARLLGKSEPEPSDSVEDLIKKLKTGTSEERVAAAEKLAVMREQAKSAVPALISALEDKDPNVQAAAATALGMLGPESRKAARALRECAKSSREDVRQAALGALALIAEKDSRFSAPGISAFAIHGGGVLRKIVRGIGKLVSGARKGVTLDRGRGTATVEIGDTTVEFDVGTTGVPLAEVLDAAITDLATGESLKRSGVFSALHRFSDERAAGAIPLLLERIKSQNAKTRKGAAGVLGAMLSNRIPEELRQQGFSSLIEALEDENGRVRSMAAFMFRDLKGEPVEALPRLTEMLRNDTFANARVGSAMALGTFGDKAEDAVPALLAALEDQDEDVRYRAAEALGKIHPEPDMVLPSLARVMRNDTPQVRSAAAIAISRYGSDAEIILSELIETAKRDRDPLTKQTAIELLGSIGPNAKDATGALVKFARNHSWQGVREAAAIAVCKIAPDSSEARDMVPLLIEYLRIGNACDAAKALGRFGAVAGKAIPTLEEVAAGKHIEKGSEEYQAAARQAAAEALKKIRQE